MSDNFYSMYLKEREHSARMESLLSRAVFILKGEVGRRERAGDDVSHIHKLIEECSQ